MAKVFPATQQSWARSWAWAAIAAASGALFSLLISPPRSWVALHLVAWIPTLFAVSRLPGRAAFWVGWSGGFALLFCMFSWLPATTGRFTQLPAAVGWLAHSAHAALFSLWVGVFAWGIRRVRTASGSFWPFAIAGWFCACEFLNPQWIPFFQASAWYEVTELFLVTTLLGMAGGSFLIVASNTVALQGIEALRVGERLGAAARNACILALLVAGAFAWSQHWSGVVERANADAPRLRVALIQSAVYGAGKRQLMRQQGSGAVADDLAALSRQVFDQEGAVDAFVWPETAIAGSPDLPYNSSVPRLAKTTGAEIWTGSSFRTSGNPVPHNSAFRVDASGHSDVRYDKNVLIPFGEYIPGTRWIPGLAQFKGLGKYSPGTETPVYASALGPFAFLICYEAILPDRVRQAVADGAQLIVNVTFDGWFGRTLAPHQHLMLTAAQAALAGVPMVRSASTGVSAVIDARGVIVARTELFERDTLTVEFPRGVVATPWMAAGDWFAWLCVVASAGLLWRSRRLSETTS